MIGNYPEYFTKSNYIDNIQFPYLFAVRTQVLSNLSSAVRLDPSLQPIITSILNFNSVPESIQLELWNDHQIMVIDNLELSTLHLSAIKAYAEKVPSQLHNWNVFGHYDPLDESLSSYFIPGNYFGNTWRSGYNIPTLVNFFPDNTKTHYSDFYSTYIALGLATMINQVTLLGTNTELSPYRDLLLTIAGNTPENYAKPPYGTEYQQGAFFPNHLVLYHASSQNFLNLALERWEEGFPYQISQFLLFANLYTVQPDSTILFEIDDEANHTCQKLYIEKDISGFINKLYLNDSCWYEFVLDDDHMVIEVIDSTTNCNPVLDCVNTCPDLVNYPDFCALMAFYESTCGPEWTNNSGWTDGFAGTDCNYTNWYGITCDENNRVISIDLSYSGNNLQGKLPPEIGDLTELQTLNLQFNHLYGEIPVELWSLTGLQSLDLAFNGLEGSLDMICNLGNLTTLLLYRNKTFWCNSSLH